MPANIFLIPLLAGYLFVHLCNRFRFRAQYLDGYRLLIESALAGVILLGISRIITLSIDATLPAVRLFWHDKIAPDPNLAYIGTAIVSLGLGILVPLISNRTPKNRLYPKIVRRLLLPRKARYLRRIVRAIRSSYQENRRAALDTEIRNHGNGLSRLLHEAATFVSLISVTLSSRKWYVGYVAEAVNLEPKESCFRLLPVLSGYRDKDTVRFVREVYYRPAYDSVRAQKGSLQRFVVTLSLGDVQDAREFDEQVYEDHFSGQSVIT